MSTAAATPQSARALARDRRRQAWSRNWRTFRSHRAGLIGLGILAGFALVAILAPVIAPAEGLEVTKATGGVLEPPSSEYWLGTDDKGRSVLTLLIWGARISLFVGLAATLISMVIGTLIGLTSGYFGGWTGAVLFRLTEWFLVIPFLPLAIVMATVLGRSLVNIVIVIGVTSWPGTALLIRAQTLTIRERPYLERARVLGAGPSHQIRKHILPNVMPMVFANTTLTVAVAILTETTLSFLGLGDPTRVSWGSMLDDAFGVGAITTGAWWFIVPPGVCVVLVVLSFTLVGQALEEVLNPRLPGRPPPCVRQDRVMRELLRFDDVSVTYGTAGGDVPAVRGVSLTVAAGEVVGVAGESGLRQVHPGRDHPAAAAAERPRHRSRPLRGRGRADHEVGRAACAALGRGVDGLPGRPALAQPRPTGRGPDLRTDQAPRARPVDPRWWRRASVSCSSRSGCRASAPGPTPTSSPAASGSAS